MGAVRKSITLDEHRSRGLTQITLYTHFRKIAKKSGAIYPRPLIPQTARPALYRGAAIPYQSH